MEEVIKENINGFDDIKNNKTLHIIMQRLVTNTIGKTKGNSQVIPWELRNKKNWCHLLRVNQQKSSHSSPWVKTKRIQDVNHHACPSHPLYERKTTPAPLCCLGDHFLKHKASFLPAPQLSGPEVGFWPKESIFLSSGCLEAQKRQIGPVKVSFW